MVFSDYAKMLYPFCSNGVKASEFVVTLFDNIMEDPTSDKDIKDAEESNYNPFAKLNIRTLEKNYSGKLLLGKPNVRKVIARLDKGKFEDYISEFPIDTNSLLKDVLASRGYKVSDAEVPATCAEIFADLLHAIVNPNTLIDMTSMSRLNTDKTFFNNAIPESDLYLLMEANGSCPSCGATLVSDKNDSSLVKYAITNIVLDSIRDELSEESDEHRSIVTTMGGNRGKIALCLDCSNRYTTNTTKDECIELIEIKERIYRNYLASEMLEKMYLEEDIESILRQIAGASQDQLSDTLNLNAVRVKDKIHSSNFPLIFKTQQYVVHYFKYIRSVFSQLEREGKLSFDDVALDVRRSFKKLEDQGLSQDEIYSSLVDWFDAKSNVKNTIACEIIVAFFIQNCEVFHAITQ